jgi:prevent-host-death family protein
VIRSRWTGLDLVHMTDPPPVVNIHDAKTHLSRYLERVEAGEEIVIGRAGRPIARLVPYARSRRPRRLGGWAGRVVITPGFDDPLPDDIGSAFDGDRP